MVVLLQVALLQSGIVVIKEESLVILLFAHAQRLSEFTEKVARTVLVYAYIERAVRLEVELPEAHFVRVDAQLFAEELAHEADVVVLTEEHTRHHLALNALRLRTRLLPGR